MVLWLVVVSCSCEGGRVSALVVLIFGDSSSCRAENSCVEAPEKPDKLRVESQLVNSMDQFCAQLSRS